MLDFGSMSDDTAISRTVALPAAIAVKTDLEKKIDLTGVHRPVNPRFMFRSELILKSWGLK